MSYAFHFIAAILMAFCGTSWSEPPDQVTNPFAPPAENEMGPRPTAIKDVPLTGDALSLAKQRIEKLRGAAPPEGWDVFVLGIIQTCRPPNTYSDDALQINSLPPPDDLLTMPREFVAEVLKRTMDEPLKSSAESWKKSHRGETPPAALASEVRSRARSSIENAMENITLGTISMFSLIGSAAGASVPVTYCLACSLFGEMPDLRTALEVAGVSLGLGFGGGLAVGVPIGLAAQRANRKYFLLEAKAWRRLTSPSPPPDGCDFTPLKSKT